MHDLQYALRVLGKSTGFTLIAILALALGIGANTAIFSVVNAVFIRPLPYPEAERLVEMHEGMGVDGEMPVSYPNYQDWRKQADAFEDMASNAVFDATLAAGSRNERVSVNYVSSGFLSILRVTPTLGRDFAPADDRPGAPPTVILTHSVWRTRFGGNAGILGQSVSLDRRPYVVIGVLPATFRFYRDADAYVPISDTLIRQMMHMRENHNNNSVIARLKAGVTPEQARAQMSTIAARLQREHPDCNTGIGIHVVPLRQHMAGSSKGPIVLLLAAVAAVLLIACVNVANLLLARAAGREKEMAIRAALGASRWRILRQLIAESLLLAMAAGAIGIILAQWSFAGLVKLVPASIAAGGLTIDARVLAFTLLVSIGTGFLFGVAPAIDAARVNLSGAMRDGTRTSGTSSRGRLRDVLVVSEVALALLLLLGTGLLLRTLNQLMRVRLGFQTASILKVDVNLPDSTEFSSVRSELFFERLVERVRSMPGVESAGAVNNMVLTGARSNMVFYRDDRPLPERGRYPDADNKVVTPGYFATLGIPLVRGRLFTAADGRITDFPRDRAMEWFGKNRFSVVINEAMARRYWPGEDPLGKTFRAGFVEMKGPQLTIIGVVGDTRDLGLDREAPPSFYWSSYHFPYSGLALVARTRLDPTALGLSIRKAASELDPSALVTNATTVEQLVSDSVASRRLNMQLLAIFAALALVLASVGIYGVMAYSVNQRRREIGVRMAMGASSSDVLRLVIRKAALLGGLGVLIGSAAALGLMRLIAGMLYGVRPADPLTFVSVATILFAVAIGASYAPARQAARLDPLVSLRCE